MASNTLLQSLRKLHLYFGVFIAPALLFFALTGALQTFGLHETNRDHPDYKPARWIVVLGQLHKKQTIVVSERRPQPPAAAPAKAEGKPEVKPAPAPQAAIQTGPKRSPLPMRVFFLIVCVGLFTSTLTGIYMAYKYNRSKVAVTLTLLAGIVLPLILVFV